MAGGRGPRRIILYPSGEVYVGQLLADETSSSSALASALGAAAASSSEQASKGSRRVRTGSSVAEDFSDESSETGSASPSSDSSGRGPGRAARVQALRDNAGARAVLLHSAGRFKAAPSRDGWGVGLRGHEKYEGEWRADTWHGLGCLNARGVERFIGCWAAGLRHGRGVTVATAGALHSDVWEAGQLASRSPLFEAGAWEDWDEEEEEEEEQEDEEEAEASGQVPEASSSSSPSRYPEEPAGLADMLRWTSAQVGRLACCMGLGEQAAARLRAHRVDGQALATLTSREAAPFLRDVFASAPSALGGSPGAEQKLLVAAVKLLLKVRHRVSVRQLAAAELRACYRDVEILEGQLEFQEMVGEGGYGHVYKARWMEADVAAKAFRYNERDLISRDFCSELRLLRRLRHPNLTLLLGFCLRPKHIIVTEFVRGGSLYDLLHRKRQVPDWSLSQVVGIAREICLGMVYLHAQDVVHCDLKSSNILLDGPREVKICDFGLAHLLDDASSQEPAVGRSTINIGCIGTHHWMAPEVLRGEEYSRAADIYSFGMILWEMISRQVPFEGYTAVQVVGLVGYGRRRPKPPRSCPEALRAMLRCSLRPRPRARKPFRELAEGLGGLLRSAVFDVEESLRLFLAG